MPQAPAHPGQAVPALGWGAFLAVSWTWCIGMFLPVILVRDYGLRGFVAFAVPNIVGAAAMGFVFNKPRGTRPGPARSAGDPAPLLDALSESGLFAARHRLAAQAFSVVTIAFHLYFLFAIVGRIFGIDAALPALLFAIAAWSFLRRTRSAGDVPVAWVTLLLSAAACVLFLSKAGPIIFNSPRISQAMGTSVLWLAPVCAFGFLLCPYLDLTFHRAAQRSPRPAMSFAIGFGVFFLAMILFTLVYSSWMSSAFAAGTTVMGIAGAVVFAHITLQSGFTIAVHIREVTWNAKWVIAILALVGLAFAVDHLPLSTGLPPGETGYRFFMGFYGLVFPAYVGIVALARRGLLMFILAVVLAAPFFALGFLKGQTVYLLPGLLLAALPCVIPSNPNRFDSQPTRP